MLILCWLFNIFPSRYHWKRIIECFLFCWDIADSKICRRCMPVLNIPDAVRDDRGALGMTTRSREIRLLQIIGNDTPGAGRRTRRWFQACLVTRDERRNAGLILRPSRRKRIYNRIEIRPTPVHTHAVRKCGTHAICRERSMTFRACCAPRRRFMGLSSVVYLGTVAH